MLASKIIDLTGIFKHFGEVAFTSMPETLGLEYLFCSAFPDMLALPGGQRLRSRVCQRRLASKIMDFTEHFQAIWFSLRVPSGVAFTSMPEMFGLEVH